MENVKQYNYQNPQDPVSFLPIEMSERIFEFFDISTLGKCCMVSSQWVQIANNENLWKRFCPPDTIDAKQWKMLFGVDVKKEPPIPRSIFKDLKTICPFSDEKKGRRDRSANINSWQNQWAALHNRDH